MLVTIAVSQTKRVPPDPAYAVGRINEATVFFAVSDATTQVCQVFTGSTQEATSRAFALQWLAAHYGIGCSGDAPRDWARVEACYEADGALYYALETVVPWP